MIETPTVQRPEPGWLAGPPAVICVAGLPASCLVVPLSEPGLEFAMDGGWAPIRARVLELAGIASDAGISAAWRVTGPVTVNLPESVPDLVTLDRLLGRADAGQPLLIRDHRSADTLLQAFHVPADLSWFSGHFPDQPILPGIVQVKFAVDGVASLLGRPAGPRTLQQLKFKAPIRPDQVVQMAIQVADGGEAAAFTFRSAAGEHSSGRLVYGER